MQCFKKVKTSVCNCSTALPERKKRKKEKKEKEVREND